MPRLRLIALISLAMFAFAGNSLLCWLALKYTSIDAASFYDGAAAFWCIDAVVGGALQKRPDRDSSGNLLSTWAVRAR